MSMYKMTSLVIILASCWVLGDATLTTNDGSYSDIGIKDKIFTENLLFEFTVRSKLDCAQKCNRFESCVTFTFHQNTCRGHSVQKTSCSASASASGARSYVRTEKVKPPIRCETTGVKRVTEPSLGLDMDVYCQDDWLVFQKRQDGSVIFDRNWAEYESGFGDVTGELWLGLRPLHIITTSYENYELRVDLRKYDGTEAFNVYSCFSVGSAADLYKMHYGKVLINNAGSRLDKNNGMNFTTKDQDNDIDATLNSAVYKKGGWWHNRAGTPMNLNGLYLPDGVSNYYQGVHWGTFGGNESLAFCQMMIRPAN